MKKLITTLFFCAILFTIYGQDFYIYVNGQKKIYDITGRMVQTQFLVSQRNAKGNELTIDISHLQNGVYFLKIENQIFKIIKN